MFVNRYQINLTTLSASTTAMTINIPITLESQEIGQSELIDRIFVDVQVENAINPISDYDKVRFMPIGSNNKPIVSISYNLDLTGSTDYSAIGFTNDDIKYEKSCFKESFIYMAFFDTPNPLTQRLIAYNTIFSKLNDNDLLGPESQQTAATGIGIPGQPRPANQVKLHFIVQNPILRPKGFSEGFYLYDYRDELKIGETKYLYMRASFKNAKTGKSVNLMVKNSQPPATPLPIDKVVHELYTRYILSRDTTGYYYKLDETYQGNLDSFGNVVVGPNNVSHVVNDVTINLYQIQSQ
jgi:hypothetical protein